jgi:hypothetical protein
VLSVFQILDGLARGEGVHGGRGAWSILQLAEGDRNGSSISAPSTADLGIVFPERNGVSVCGRSKGESTF